MKSRLSRTIDVIATYGMLSLAFIGAATICYTVSKAWNENE